MKKFTFDESMQFKIMSEKQVKEIHETALYVLENLGMSFAYEEALHLHHRPLTFMTEKGIFTAHSGTARLGLIPAAVQAISLRQTGRA